MVDRGQSRVSKCYQVLHKKARAISAVTSWRRHNSSWRYHSFRLWEKLEPTQLQNTWSKLTFYDYKNYISEFKAAWTDRFIFKFANNVTFWYWFVATIYEPSVKQCTTNFGFLNSTRMIDVIVVRDVSERFSGQIE